MQLPKKQLLGPDGRPISSSQYDPRMTKAEAPKLGNAFGDWAGRDQSFLSLPGGGVVQFDLSQLRVSDFRGMRDHYQVNASLAVLSFIQHQATFHVECDDKKVGDEVDQQLHENWTMLNRGMAQANWSGYSPNVLEWDNDVTKRRVILSKVKDLVPEECTVNWKLVEQWAPPGRVKPKTKVYDGIKQWPGTGWPIPVESTFWYPILMENGDYYGRKLLRPAFQAWYFSLLMHLFANRYYERFGEPTPIGRAPYDEKIRDGGHEYNGAEWMLNTLKQLRNRSVVVLPNDTHQVGASTNNEYEYDIEYLESQMRGADFERYMTRLDEEISIGLFTPILLLRTADVGSYNLGTQHKGTYSIMTDALNDDRAFYLDKYVGRKIADYNFSPNSADPHVKFTKMGNTDKDLVKDVLLQLIKGGAATVDLTELGEALGMTVKQIRQTIAKQDTGTGDGGDTGHGGDTGADTGNSTAPTSDQKARLPKSFDVAESILAKVQHTVRKADERGELDNTKLSFGYKKTLYNALKADGVDPHNVEGIYRRLDAVAAEALAIPDYWDAEGFMNYFSLVLYGELDRL